MVRKRLALTWLILSGRYANIVGQNVILQVTPISLWPQEWTNTLCESELPTRGREGATMGRIIVDGDQVVSAKDY